MMERTEPKTTRAYLPTEGQIDVWVLDLDSDDSTSNRADLLSADEKARASRFHFERDRRRFVAGRSSLRNILAHYVSHPADGLRFCYSEQGKPSLADVSTDIRFNLSHSDQYGILAVTRAHEIGMDIEKIRGEVETDKLAERFFSVNERLALRSMPAGERVAAFYRGWACKEALLKAWGTGLSRPLSTFDVDLKLNNPAALLATRPDPAEANLWSLRMLNVVPGYASALAVEGPIESLNVRAFQH